MRARAASPLAGLTALDRLFPLPYNMNTMRQLFFSLSFLIASAAAPLRAEITAPEKAVMDACVSNISEKVYSPAEAGKCLGKLHAGNDALYHKFKAEDGERLTYALKYGNIFKELGEFFEDEPSLCVIRERYVALLENDKYQKACVLCEIDMAPQPDKTFPWIQRYYNGSLDTAKQAGLAWETLGAAHKTNLARIGSPQDRWAELRLSERTATLMAEDSLFTSGVFDRDIAPCGTAGDNLQRYMDGNLPTDIRGGIRSYLAAAMPARPAGGTGGTGPDSSKYSAAALKAKNMAGKSDAELMAYLGRTFDNSAGSGGVTAPGLTGSPPRPAGTGTSAASYTLPPDKWEKVASEVKTRMLGGVSEMDGKNREPAFSGTKMDDELRDFYNKKGPDGKPANGMKLRVLDLGSGGTNGAYCPKHNLGGCGSQGPGEIAINKQLIEEWMKKKNITADQLLNDPAAMDRLGYHLYPVTLHEGIHNVHQDEYFRANGVPNKRQLDKEVAAFSGQALGVKAKLADPKTARLYAPEMSEFDMEVLGELENGGYRGMKKFVRYYDIEGTQGASAKSFTQMEAALKEINLRKTSPGYDENAPASPDCSWFRTDRCSTAQLRTMTNEAYPWYETAIKRQRSDIESISAELTRLNSIDASERWKTLQAGKPVGT